MCKHDIVSCRKRIYHVHIIIFNCLMILLITCWYIQTKEKWQSFVKAHNKKHNMKNIYLGCNHGAPTPGSPKLIDLSFTNSFFLYFLDRELITPLPNKQRNFWHRFFCLHQCFMFFQFLNTFIQQYQNNITNT